MVADALVVWFVFAKKKKKDKKRDFRDPILRQQLKMDVGGSFRTMLVTDFFVLSFFLNLSV